MAKKHQRSSFDGAQVNARFDNARNTPDTASLFRGVDSLAMNAALSPSVRRTVRDRARYIVYNCPYVWGMLDTYVTDIVGTWITVVFPRGGIPETLRDEITDAFDVWALKTDFWGKLKTIIRAKTTDGEAFATFYTDPTIVDAANPVSLNVAPIECDRVESWTEMLTREDETDGIRFDKFGHPVEYRILKYHPGDYRAIKNIKGRAGEWVKAAKVIHYFETLRPEQVRGISDFVSCLEIPAEQKSYRSSVTTTAINAASVSGVLSTDQVPECFDDEEQSLGRCAMEVKPNTVFQAQRGAFVTLPEGWHLNQLQAQQPTSIYPEFVRALIAEMARCLSMPVNIAMCDSSHHNFASAKLDHMIYFSKIAAVRSTLVAKVLDRVFFKWLDEFAVLRRIDPRTLAALHRTEWLFTERGNSDVLKDASADNTRLGNATVSYATLYAKDGKDWKRELDQAIAERIYILSRWREGCKEKGWPEDTPCPFSAKSAATGGKDENAAPTEDELEHDSQKNLNPNNRAQGEITQADADALWEEVMGKEDGE